MFGINAAGETAFGVVGLPGQTLAALAATCLVAAIGFGTERLSHTLQCPVSRRGGGASTGDQPPRRSRGAPAALPRRYAGQIERYPDSQCCAHSPKRHEAHEGRPQERPDPGQHR